PVGETIVDVVFGVSLLGVSVEVACAGGSPVVNGAGDWTCSFLVPTIQLGTYWVFTATPAGLEFSNNTFTVTSASSAGAPASLFGAPILDLEILGVAGVSVAIGAAAVVLGRRGKAPPA